MASCCKEKKCNAIIYTKPVLNENIKSTFEFYRPFADFSFGEKLQSVYPLLDMIFTYLNYKDLLFASAVCKIWREVALKHLKSRQEVGWFSITGNKRTYELKRSNNLLRCNTHFSIILTHSRQCSFKANICVKYNDYHSCCQVPDYLQKYVLGHPFRETIILGSMDITSHLDVTQKAEQFSNKLSVVEGLTIPEIPKVRVVYIRPQNLSDNIRESYVKTDETINSLLIFCANNQKQNVCCFLGNLLNGQNPKEVAIAGGIITGSKKHFSGSQLSTEIKNVYCDIHCVAFLQQKNEEPNLLSYSLVIPDEIPLNNFQKELIKFREEITAMRSQSVAFRFSCSCKETSRQDETYAFNSVFPDTPLLGLDVFGEIGWDTVVFHNECENSMRKKRKSSNLPCIFHEWSTTFLLITWDK